jgi:hypothetical protein
MRDRRMRKAPFIILGKADLRLRAARVADRDATRRPVGRGPIALPGADAAGLMAAACAAKGPLRRWRRCS